VQTGLKINSLSFSTYVAANTGCTSACANIWLAGKPRYAEPTAKIGFHQAYIKDQHGRIQRFPQGNAFVRDYYAKIGISKPAADFLLSADPKDMYWLNGNLAKGFGIEIASFSTAPKKGLFPQAVSSVPQQNTATMPQPKATNSGETTDYDRLVGTKSPEVPKYKPFPKEMIDYLKSQSEKWMIQVGLLESESEARARIDLVRNQAREDLGKADPLTEEVVAGDNRKLFRASFVGLGRDQAEAVCRTLKRTDIDCVTVFGGRPQLVAIEPKAAIDAVDPVAQRVVLYDEIPSDLNGKQYVGTVIWRTEPVKAAEKPEIGVRADIDIPDRKFKMTIWFRRNTDTSLPASHTAELTFILPQDFSGGSVGNVPGILMKSNEQARDTPLTGREVKVTDGSILVGHGTPLAGRAVKVTDGFFLVGLSNVDADRARNLQLLKERSWFDVPVVYANQRRAIIAIEKGALGERAFNEAFAAWGE
jgi:hypothetical protein